MRRFVLVMFTAITCLLGLSVLPCSLAVAAEPEQTAAFFRFYRPYPQVPQVHRYSTEAEIDGDWTYEGIEGYIAKRRLSYTVPLYHLFNSLQWDNVYTTREAERSRLLSSSYISEQDVAGYVLPADRDIPGSVPLYRFSRTFRVGDQYYRDRYYSLNSTPPSSYVAEGVCCRVWQDPLALPEVLFRLTEPESSDTWIQGSVQRIGWQVWTGGGYIRIYYSDDDGESWKFIDAVSVPKTYGVVSSGDYKWKVPTSVFGKIRIKLAWVKENEATVTPWFSETTSELRIINRRLLPITTR